MFIFAKIDYHKLIDWFPGPTESACWRWWRSSWWAQGPRRPALDQAGAHALPALRVGQAGSDSGRGPLLCQSGRALLTWKDIFKAFALVGLPMLLVLMQPDLGTALTYTPILIAGLLLGGINVRQALILVTCRLAADRRRLEQRQGLKPYQKARLTSFIDPDNDPKGTGYQLRQSQIAVGSGGVWGKGAAKGTQTQGDFLPIPHADFIFAALGEEHGFVGAIFVLLLYFSILMRLIQNAQTAADLSGSLIIMGVVAVLTFQIAVNVGMVIGFMPVTGIPLPLMSYGGSSVLFTFLALGVAMNVRMRRFVN